MGTSSLQPKQVLGKRRQKQFANANAIANIIPRLPKQLQSPD